MLITLGIYAQTADAAIINLTKSDEDTAITDIYERITPAIVVVDATCLERSLNLVFQVLEMTSKVIVCVNLLDEAKKKSITIDLNKLSSLLGVPVIRNYCK